MAAAFVGVGLLVSLLYGALSDGVHHLDDLTHYLIARSAWTWPSYLLHNWGRPGFTVLYWLPAGWGWHAARAWSAVLSAATAWMAFRIAQEIGLRRAWIVPLFLYLQPRFFTLALTTLTETALGLYLTASLLMALRGRWTAAAALLSPGICSRHEAIVFVPVFVLAAWAAGQPLRRLWPLIWAPAAVNLIAWACGQPTMLASYGRAAGSGIYGSGNWYEFLARTLEAFGPAIAVLGLAGIGATLRRRGGVLIVACVVVYLSAHTLVRMFGLFDSGGYARFLVPIGPLWAILAVAAWNRLLSRDAEVRAAAGVVIAAASALVWFCMELQIRTAARLNHWAVIAAEYPNLTYAAWAVRICTGLIIIMAVVAWILTRGGPSPSGPSSLALRVLLGAMMILAWHSICHVLHPPPREVIADEELAWLRDNGYGDRPVVCASIWVDYRLNTPLAPGRPDFAQRVDAAPRGAIIMWDRQAAAVEAHPKVPCDELFIRDVYFRHLHRSRDLSDGQPAFQLFEKVRDGGNLSGELSRKQAAAQ